jgi:hypothetical protein
VVLEPWIVSLPGGRRIGSSTIAAGTIGWQAGGGNTFVYANTSTRTESLAGADMKIELRGVVALTTTNFPHL